MAVTPRMSRAIKSVSPISPAVDRQKPRWVGVEHVDRIVRRRREEMRSRPFEFVATAPVLDATCPYGQRRNRADERRP